MALTMPGPMPVTRNTPSKTKLLPCEQAQLRGWHDPTVGSANGFKKHPCPHNRKHHHSYYHEDYVAKIALGHYGIPPNS